MINNNNPSSIGGRAQLPEKRAVQSSAPAVPEKAAGLENSHIENVAATTSAPDIKAPDIKVPTSEESTVMAASLDKAMGSTLDKAQVLSDEEKVKVSEAIVHVESYMQSHQRTLNFKMAEEDNRVIITVIDRETKEVIRQIPPEDVVRISDAITSGDVLASGGILIQSKA